MLEAQIFWEGVRRALTMLLVLSSELSRELLFEL
jgi:hypothetical protein